MSLLTHPVCFVDAKQYREWRKVAMIAKEPCSPCSDCSPRYRNAMVEDDRCYPVDVKSVYRVFAPIQTVPENEHERTD